MGSRLTAVIGATQGTGASPALYTVLGATITAVVTLGALIMKHRWDVAAERRARDADLATLRLNHNHELLRLEHELALVQEAAQRQEIRIVCGRFLLAVHDVYSSIVTARRVRRVEPDDVTYRTVLASIAPGPGQGSLEELRLIAAPPIVAAAEELWDLVRSDDVAMGVNTGSEEWLDWKARYWDKRSVVVEKARDALGTKR